MPRDWKDIPFPAPLYLNGDERAGKRVSVVMENCYINDQNGLSRFWGLRQHAVLPDHGRVYLHDWRGDIIAVTSNGQVFRVDLNGTVQRVSGVLVGGKGRCVFQPTERSLTMAAGAEVVAFSGRETRLLSDDAPRATHLGYIDGFLVANEAGSPRWMHANTGEPETWDPVNVFTADAQPDNITAILVSPFREMLFAGPESVEQWERLRSSDTPFYRRYATPASLQHPYAMVFADNAVYALVEPGEVARLSGQTSQVVSQEINRFIERLDDRTDAWMGGFQTSPLEFDGQRMILLQFPNATNRYGTKGVTLVYSFVKPKAWFELFGHDTRKGLPSRWPGWSHHSIGSRTFVGGEGVIYEMDRDTWWHDGQPAVMRIKTGHLMEAGESRVDDIRLQIKRGVARDGAEAKIRLRAHRDNKSYTRWVERSLGTAAKDDLMVYFGQMGSASSWQFEIEVSSDCQVEIRKMQGQMTQLGF